MLEEYNDAIVETTATGKKLIYRKVNGRIDNNRYATDHRDHFLQPDNPKFIKVYGQKAKDNCLKFYKDAEKSKDTKRQAMEAINEIIHRKPRIWL